MVKYKKQLLKYLIEILIIIIGIIIAFYLTEYGETLNRNRNEEAIANQIYLDLKDNLEDLERDFVIHRTGLIGHLNAIKFLDEAGPVTDSLIMDFYWMTREEYIFANNSGYENLKSFGINLIRDDSLRNLISLIYNHNFPRISKGNTLYPDINEYLTPFFKTNFKINTDTSLKYTLHLNDTLKVTYPRDIAFGVKQTIGYLPKDRNQLLENEEFRFLVTNALEYRMYKYSYYQVCINNVRKAIQKIEKQYF